MPQTDTETLTARSLARLADAAEAISDDVKSTAKGRLHDVIDLASRAYDQSRDRALGAVGQADGFVRHRSLMILGIAAATGLLVGLALRGGKRAEPPATVTAADPAAA